MAINIETLRNTENITPIPYVNAIIFGIQKHIIKNQKFIFFNGQIHESLYLKAPEIIFAMKNLLSFANESPAISATAEKIINDGWVPLFEMDSFSRRNRKIALSCLFTISNIASSKIKERYLNKEITERDFRGKTQKVEGIRLSAFSEINPQRYAVIERSLIRK